MSQITRTGPLLLLALSACTDVEEHDHHHHDHEVMTTVVLTFTSQTDGSEFEFRWADPEDDGDPVIDDIFLQDAEAYDLSLIFFLNELEDPYEDITPELLDESDEHQVFFTGSGVQGPATGTNADAVLEHAYADEDGNGFSVGFDNTITALAVGTGELTVTLRHLPLEDGNPVKTEDMAETVADSGFGAIGGANDVQVTFPVEVE